MRAKRKTGDDAEAIAGALDGPEEIGVGTGAGDTHGAAGGNPVRAYASADVTAISPQKRDTYGPGQVE